MFLSPADSELVTATVGHVTAAVTFCRKKNISETESWHNKSESSALWENHRGQKSKCWFHMWTCSYCSCVHQDPPSTAEPEPLCFGDSPGGICVSLLGVSAVGTYLSVSGLWWEISCRPYDLWPLTVAEPRGTGGTAVNDLLLQLVQVKQHNTGDQSKSLSPLGTETVPLKRSSFSSIHFVQVEFFYLRLVFSLHRYYRNTKI